MSGKLMEVRAEIAVGARGGTRADSRTSVSADRRFGADLRERRPPPERPQR